MNESRYRFATVTTSCVPRARAEEAPKDLVRGAGLSIVRSALRPRTQPDLEWNFETAATSEENRAAVLEAVRNAAAHAKASLKLADEAGEIVWWWPMLTLLAHKN